MAIKDFQMLEGSLEVSWRNPSVSLSGEPAVSLDICAEGEGKMVVLIGYYYDHYAVTASGTRWDYMGRYWQNYCRCEITITNKPAVDIYEDGKIDVNDALELVKKFASGEVPEGTDYNNDGDHDTEDAVYLFSYTLLPKLYPIE